MSFITNHKILVCIIVYDRIKNLNLWLTAWNSCDKLGAKIAVIHNNDGTNLPQYKELCDKQGVDFYCPRYNNGFDIGALQDLQQRRLKLNQELNNHQYDYLFWSVDDCLPLSKNFLEKFLLKFSTPDTLVQRTLVNTTAAAGCGICGVQISNEYRRHLRTNTFMLSSEVFNTIKFPTDPIRNKEECYQFEHRSKTKETLTDQVERLGLRVEQVDPNFHKLFWDINHNQQLRLWNLFYREFPSCIGIKP